MGYIIFYITIPSSVGAGSGPFSAPAAPALRKVTTPLGPVNQSLHAIADFYEQPATQKSIEI
jgi:hypothetical protein